MPLAPAWAGVGGESLDQRSADAAIAEGRRQVDVQMGGKLRRGSREIVKAARLIERAEEIAGYRAVRRHRQIGPLRVVDEVARQPALAKSCARVLAGKRLGAARLEKDRVELVDKALRVGNLGPAPDAGNGGVRVDRRFGHRPIVLASLPMRKGPDRSGPQHCRDCLIIYAGVVAIPPVGAAGGVRPPPQPTAIVAVPPP